MVQRKVFERYLSETEERNLMKVVRDTAGPLARRDEAWLVLLRQTGIRVTPLSKLTVGDARAALADGALTIRGETNKRQCEHRVWLNRKAREALEALLRVRREFAQDALDDAPLIVSREHRGMSVRSLQQRFSFWRAKAGLRDGSPHWMRHTLAKRLMARSTSNNPLQVVAGVLGHSSLTSTCVYTLPDKEELQQAIEAAA